MFRQSSISSPHYFASLLRETRKKQSKSLRNVVGDAFSQQTLSNYERGILPSQKNLAKIASIYGIDITQLEEAYKASLPQSGHAPVKDDPLVDLLRDVKPSDHIVRIAQNSVLPESVENRNSLLSLAKRGASVTYVASLPRTSNPISSPELSTGALFWTSNHLATAALLWTNIAGIKRDCVKKAINYLVIGTPQAADYSFLHVFENTSYVYRERDGEHGPCAWTEIKTPDGKKWWIPRDEEFLRGIYHWLYEECGLMLPSARLSDSPKRSDIAIFTLEEFVQQR